MGEIATLETARLSLHTFRDEDVTELYRIQGDPVAMRYTFWASSRAESATRLRAYAALAEEMGYGPWTVMLRNEGRIIGWGGLNIDPFDPGWGVEVAYFFAPAYWGRGYATELVQAALREGFQRHNLREINAFAHRENCASTRVLKKCGFQFHQFEPQLDRDRYVLARDLWEQRQQQV